VKRGFLPILLFVALLAACSKPIPESRLSYVGEWKSKQMRLLILRDGSVAYKRLKGGATVSVTGPLKEFVGDDFVVGVRLFTTTFAVSRPPQKVDGKWPMVVDGVRLTKAAE